MFDCYGNCYRETDAAETFNKKKKKRLEDQEGTRKKKKHYFKLLFYGLGKLRGKKAIYTLWVI